MDVQLSGFVQASANDWGLALGENNRPPTGLDSPSQRQPATDGEVCRTEVIYYPEPSRDSAIDLPEYVLPRKGVTLTFDEFVVRCHDVNKLS